MSGHKRRARAKRLQYERARRPAGVSRRDERARAKAEKRRELELDAERERKKARESALTFAVAAIAGQMIVDRFLLTDDPDDPLGFDVAPAVAPPELEPRVAAELARARPCRGWFCPDCRDYPEHRREARPDSLLSGLVLWGIVGRPWRLFGPLVLGCLWDWLRWPFWRTWRTVATFGTRPAARVPGGSQELPGADTAGAAGRVVRRPAPLSR